MDNPTPRPAQRAEDIRQLGAAAMARKSDDFNNIEKRLNASGAFATLNKKNVHADVCDFALKARAANTKPLKADTLGALLVSGLRLFTYDNIPLTPTQLDRFDPLLEEPTAEAVTDLVAVTPDLTVLDERRPYRPQLENELGNAIINHAATSSPADRSALDAAIAKARKCVEASFVSYDDNPKRAARRRSALLNRFSGIAADRCAAAANALTRDTLGAFTFAYVTANTLDIPYPDPNPWPPGSRPETIPASIDQGLKDACHDILYAPSQDAFTALHRDILNALGPAQANQHLERHQKQALRTYRNALSALPRAQNSEEAQQQTHSAGMALEKAIVLGSVAPSATAEMAVNAFDTAARHAHASCNDATLDALALATWGVAAHTAASPECDRRFTLGLDVFGSPEADRADALANTVAAIQTQDPAPPERGGLPPPAPTRHLPEPYRYYGHTSSTEPADAPPPPDIRAPEGQELPSPHVPASGSAARGSRTKRTLRASAASPKWKKHPRGRLRQGRLRRPPGPPKWTRPRRRVRRGSKPAARFPRRGRHHRLSKWQRKPAKAASIRRGDDSLESAHGGALPSPRGRSTKRSGWDSGYVSRAPTPSRGSR